MGPQANDFFGYCVSTAGDVNGDGYNDVIAGAPLFQNGQSREGAVFLYYGQPNGLNTNVGWSCEGNQSIAVFSSNYGNSMGFGASVSDAGDVNGDGYGDVIVGSPFYSNGQAGEGKAFVFLGSPSGLQATPAWSYEPDIDSARFGFSVSTAGDVNGDGYSDVVVGAPSWNNGQVKEGRAFVFYGSASGVSATPSIILEENNTNSWFGWCVSAAGDVNGDGFSDVLISAPYFDGTYVNEGKAFVYHGSAAGISSVANWAVASNWMKAGFGGNVSWAGDVNGDGYSDIIIGADQFSNTFLNPYVGRFYIFHGSASGLLPTPAFNLSMWYVNSYFGTSVSGAGDVNGDGYADVVVGASGLMNPSYKEGGIFIFYGTPSGITSTLYTQIESNISNTELGISVCSAGDVNGDGFTEIIAGAHLYDKTTAPAASNVGAFYVYSGSPENVGSNPVPATPFTLNQAGAQLGNFVTTVGDVNADGYSDMAVGASMYDNGKQNTGIVYVFHGSSTGFSSLPSTVINGPLTADGFFGCSIGAAGDVNGDGFSDIVIGASGFNNAATPNEGAAFLYLGSPTGILSNAFLQLEGNLINAQFGYSVAGAGDVNGDGYSDIIIGAKSYNGGTPNEGKAFVYYGGSGGPDGFADWQYQTSVGEEFGTCVTGVGDCNGDGYSDVVVLSSKWSNGQADEGRLFYFRGSSSGLESGPAAIKETNVANSLLHNQSACFAGDINGDGYNEVTIGLGAYNSGSTPGEGAIMLFYGNSSGIALASPVLIESNSANSGWGTILGFAGDVNNDGYNDLVSGSPAYSKGHASEGCIQVFAGSPAGLISIPLFTYEPNKSSALCGASAGCAGDVNSDGYSDLVLGMPGYDSLGLADAGRIMVLHGNNAHNILSRSYITRQLKSDLVSVVQSSNGTFEEGCVFGISHFEKSSLGRTRAKLAYEYRGHPDPFLSSGTLMSTSVSFSGVAAAYTDLGLNGTTLKVSVTAPGIGFPKWRCRSRFRASDALDGQIFSRWQYQGIHDKHDRSIKIDIECGLLPIEVVEVSIKCNGQQNGLQWQMANEATIAWYAVYVSANGDAFHFIGGLSPENKTNYYYELPLNDSIKYARLEVTGVDGAVKIFTLGLAPCYENEALLLVYPNPTDEVINFRLVNIDEVPASIF
ncbi:MAG TPA: integrin alpha, partial [Flavobacteriales bacterium]|nr:integrin alpha [Flavobacteriales bacterium]